MASLNAASAARPASPRELSQMRGLFLQVDDAIELLRRVSRLADQIAGPVPISDEGDAAAPDALADELTARSHQLQRARNDAAAAIERIQGVLG